MCVGLLGPAQAAGCQLRTIDVHVSGPRHVHLPTMQPSFSIRVGAKNYTPTSTGGEAGRQSRRRSCLCEDTTACLPSSAGKLHAHVAWTGVPRTGRTPPQSPGEGRRPRAGRWPAGRPPATRCRWACAGAPITMPCASITPLALLHCFAKCAALVHIGPGRRPQTWSPGAAIWHPGHIAAMPFRLFLACSRWCSLHHLSRLQCV